MPKFELAHQCRLAILLLLTALASGCVYSPENGDRLSGHTNQSYWGFSDRPNDTVIMEAYDHPRGRWTQVATTTSSSSSIKYGGVTLYSWVIHFQLDTIARWQCYAYPQCRPTEGDNLRLRFRSPASRFGDGGLQFYSFDQGATGCVHDRVRAGDPITIAYDECMDGQHARELALGVWAD